MIIIFASCRSLYKQHYETVSRSSLGDKPPERRLAVRTYTKTIRNGRVKLNHILMHQSTVHRSFSHWRAEPTVIPVVPHVTFTLSIQPPLGLPHTRFRHTYVIHTIPAIGKHQFAQCVQTISKWALLDASSLSIVTFSHCSAPLHSLINSIHSITSTKLLEQFISRTFTFPLSTLPISYFMMLHLSHTTPLVQLHNHMLFSTLFISTQTLYSSHLEDAASVPYNAFGTITQSSVVQHTFQR